MRLFIAAVFASGWACSVCLGQVETPQLMTLKGYATDLLGVPVSTGDVSARLYDAWEDGTEVYNSGTDFDGAIVGGSFDLLLGSITPLDLVHGQTYYMEVSINATGELAEDVIGAANRQPVIAGGSNDNSHHHDNRYPYDPNHYIQVQDNEIEIKRRLDLNGKTMYGALSCEAVVVECNGDCANAGSPDDICNHLHDGDWKPVAVSCDSSQDDSSYWPCGSSAQCHTEYFDQHLGKICDDGSSDDAVITCCDAREDG